VVHLQIIVGSTREGRAVDGVADWVQRRAEAHEAFDVEVLDLRDWPLPMFAEGVGTLGDRKDPAWPVYSDPLVKRWNDKIAEGDAFLFITPEYNHSFSGVLKNAIDNVFVSFAFRYKPAAFVGYSTGLVGGARAVEQLALVTIELEMVPLRNATLVGRVGQAFDGGEPVDPMSDIALGITLDDVAWWGEALNRARENGMPAPGTQRMMAAMRR
jgi:NAD(P)H-dependent FMN reductase